MYNRQKKAFTLIEILVSVAIVLLVVVGVIKMSQQNRNMITYILKRGSVELDNSLYLTKKVQRYTNDKKTAYDLLVDEFSIKDFDSREILKKIEKKINITDYVEMPVTMDEAAGETFIFYTNEVLLKGDSKKSNNPRGNYSARYYTFK